MKKYTAKVKGTFWVDVEVTAQDEEEAKKFARWRVEQCADNFDLLDDRTIDYNFQYETPKIIESK